MALGRSATGGVSLLGGVADPADGVRMSGIPEPNGGTRGRGNLSFVTPTVHDPGLNRPIIQVGCPAFSGHKHIETLEIPKTQNVYYGGCFMPVQSILGISYSGLPNKILSLTASPKLRSKILGSEIGLPRNLGGRKKNPRP